MSKLKRVTYNLLQIFKTVTTLIKRLITRGVLIFSSLLSFTVFLVHLGAVYLKSPGDAMTAGGLFFTFVFSIWQFVEDMKEKNCKTILDIEDNINERIDFIVTQFTKALEDTRTRSEKEDEIHNNKLDSNENRIVNINSELANIRELLTHHLNSFGHTRSIEQQQDIITRLAKVEAELKLSLEYKKIEDCNSQLSNAIESLKKDFTALQNSLER